MKEGQTNLKALFEAEEAANKTIREAEEKRERMMEQAYTDANEKVEQFRKEKEAELAQTLAKNQNNFDEMMKAAEQVKKVNDSEFAANKEKIVEDVLARIFKVGLELNKNVKGDFHKTFKKVVA